MSWAELHQIAEVVDVWSSLLVNGFLVAGGIGYAVKEVRSPNHLSWRKCRLASGSA